MVSNEPEDVSEFQVNLCPRLHEDSIGYYHYTTNRNDCQKINRIDGDLVAENNYPVEFVRFEWESDLFWYLGDTGSISASNYTGLGFIIFSKII